MARDIPGYYFDPEKGKYFKIQPNHAVPSAIQHSKQAVDAKRASVKRRKLDGQLQTRRLGETVQRSRLLDHPLMDRVRIRNAIGGIRAHITTEVAAYYSASLSRTTVLRYSYPRVCITKFAIDEATAAMITASTGASNVVAHQMHSPRTQHPPYPSDACVSVSVVSNPVTALLITPRPANYVLWATSATASAHGTVRVVPFSSEPERGAAPRPHRPEDPSLALVNYDNMGVSWSIPESDIWDMTASPSGRTVVAACSSGLRIFGDLNHGLDNLMRRTNDREYMAVSFKDENIVFGGTRAGTVRIVDLRSLNGGTSRLRHGSGVAAVRALSNDNYVVVRGLEKMSIYDLRFTPLSNYSLSKPYTTFQGSYSCDRFGLGFDYDPSLDLFATAHSAAIGPAELTGHRISLFSARTGKIVPSPLNCYAFPAPVTCIQFSNAIRSRCADSSVILADDGRPRENNEPKSIITASGDRINEWSVQGLGVEDEWQE